MKTLPYIFCLLIVETYSVLPTWNLTTSPIDLLKIRNPYTYNIDHRNWWYDTSDEFSKTITKDADGKITYTNNFKMQALDWGDIKYSGNVDFEAIESFYSPGDASNHKLGNSIICPRGNYNPLKVTSTSTFTELSFPTNWKKTDKFDLKCYLHRSQGGHLLIHYLMNKENYLLELDYNSNLTEIGKYELDIEEMYDFKLLNNDGYGDKSGDKYAFIGLIKKMVTFV